MRAGIFNFKSAFALVVVFGSLVVASCDPGVKFGKVNTGSLLSVTSLISPQDSILRVYLYRVSEINSKLDPQSSVVKDALVIITDNLNTDTLHLSPDEMFYQTDTSHITIVPTKEYYLHVSAEGYTSINAQCTIPTTSEIPSISGSMAGNNYLFSMFWTNPTQHSFYIPRADAAGQYEVSTPRGIVFFSLLAQLDITRPQKDQPMSQQVNGIISFANMADSVTLTCEVWNLDYNMYNFYEAVFDYQSWLINSDEVLPNFASPTPIFSNIENGMGVFGAYNASKSTLKVK